MSSCLQGCQGKGSRGLQVFRGLRERSGGLRERCLLSRCLQGCQGKRSLGLQAFRSLRERGLQAFRDLRERGVMVFIGLRESAASPVMQRQACFYIDEKTSSYKITTVFLLRVNDELSIKRKYGRYIKCFEY